MEATLACASALALKRGVRQQVYLTALGGGAFGNELSWIVSAVRGALQKYSAQPIDVHLVHYFRGSIHPDFIALKSEFDQQSAL